MEGLEFYKSGVIVTTEFTFTSRYINDKEKEYINELSSSILGIALEEIKWSWKKNLCSFKWLGDVDITSGNFVKFRTELDTLLARKG